MSDYEEMESLLEYLISSAKSERKKKSKKNKRSPKKQVKKNSTTETDKRVQKKKKKKDSKFKEVLKGKKDKVEGKKKKKKKNKPTVELDDNVVAIKVSDGEAKPAAEHKTLNPLRNGELQHEQLTEKPQEIVRQKKKVAFDLTPGCVKVKRPKFSSPSLQPPRENPLLESESVREAERCSQVTAMEHSHTQTHYNDSQCTSDDINSQDLFITQKTFREPPSLPSSDEAIDKAITTPPAVAQMEQHHDDSFKDSHFHQHHRESAEHVQRPKTEQLLLTEEKEEDRIIRNVQKQEKEDLCPIFKKSRLNPYLDEPIVIRNAPEVTKPKNNSLSSGKVSPTRPQPLKVSPKSTFTQTENFFTTELSSFLKFGQKVREAVNSEDLQPLDLSLPSRARNDLRKTFSASEEMKSDNSRNMHCSCCVSGTKEKLRESMGQSCSVSTPGKSERSASSQSESDNKSADTTTSSEDGETSCRASKLDLVQARAVQMRLNESFFFKTKGEGHSPRPESPLMKLAKTRPKMR